MEHEPQITIVNGKPAEWTDDICKLWQLVIAAHFEGETRSVSRANYFTPRPYVDEYNSGSNQSGFTYTVGRDVCQHIFPRSQS